MVSVPSSSLVPLPPSGAPPVSSSSSALLLNHRRSQQFSSKILAHGGPVRDTSIQAATLATRRKETHFALRCAVMDGLAAEFAAELSRVEAIKRDLVLTQQTLMQHTLEWYSALCIQQFYRRTRATQLLVQFIKSRLLIAWIHFRLHFRRICRTARKLCCWIKRYRQRHRLIILLKCGYAARKIQRHVRRRRQVRVLWDKVKLLILVKKSLGHIMLFGGRRAVREIVKRIRESEEAAEATTRTFRNFLAKCIQRTRRRL
jgi:hypothetical protein